MPNWIDPRYCVHGVTIGARCTKCGGTANGDTNG